MPANDGQEVARALIDELLALTEVEERISAEVLTLHRLALGLFARSRRLLRAICVLSDEGFLDCAPGVTRSILEHTGTIRWLLDNPEKNEEIFMRAELTNMGKLAKLAPHLYDSNYASLLALAKQEWNDPERKVKLPPIIDRVGREHYQYAYYSDLCGADHSALASAAFYLDVNGDSVTFLGDRPHQGVEQKWLPLSGVQVWVQAALVGNACGMAFMDKIAPLGLALNEQINTWSPSSKGDK